MAILIAMEALSRLAIEQWIVFFLPVVGSRDFKPTVSFYSIVQAISYRLKTDC
jgi:hypothetical protein